MKKTLRRLAWLVSRAFEPAWEIPVIMLMAVRYSVPIEKVFVFSAVLMIVDVITPAIFAITRAKKGKLTDFDVTKREERKPLYLFTLGCHTLGVVVTALAGEIRLAEVLGLLLFVSLCFMWINNYWKISVHGGVNALLMVTLNVFWGWRSYGWMVSILLLVIWSRVYLRKHTLTQVMAGAALATLLSVVGFQLLGY